MGELKLSRDILLIAAPITMRVFVNLTTARVAMGEPLSPTNLRCEHLRNPPGVDVREPRFAWVLGHAERGQKQSAYQVLVAFSAEFVARDKAVVWAGSAGTLSAQMMPPIRVVDSMMPCGTPTAALR